MMPHSCTIYNKYREGSTDKYQRSVLHGVYWDGTKGANVLKSGLTSADGLLLLIPFMVQAGGQYVKPKAFAALPDKAGFWTLQAGDKAVKGECTYEVQKSAMELGNQFDDVLTITSIDTHDYGGSMAHWEVSGE